MYKKRRLKYQIERTMTDAVTKLFLGKNFAHVATISKDGTPQITPTWIDIKDGIILINTAEGRIKHTNTSRDPRVAISIADQNNPYVMVTVRGKVIEQTNLGADEHIDKLAKKYLGLDKYPFGSPTEKRIILRVKPEKIFYSAPQG